MEAWGPVFTGAVLAALSVAAMADGFRDGFGDPALTGWHRAHYDFSHPHFDTDWRRQMLRRNRLELGLVLNLSLKGGKGNRFAGASLRRKDVSGFGRYEVVLQPARGEGAITGFFTYTGPYYGTRHDEIDMEFLGRETTAVQLSWFTGGVRRSKRVALGYDAADAPRHYAFDWHPNEIRWYADGRLLHRELSSAGHLPSVPGRLFFNIWAASPALADWAGAADDNLNTRALLQEAAFTPLAENQLAQFSE